MLEPASGSWLPARASSVAVSSENRGQCPAKVVRFGSSLIEENSLTGPAVTVRTNARLKIVNYFVYLKPRHNCSFKWIAKLLTRKYLTIAKTGQESDRHF